MSKTVARIIESFTSITTAPLNDRQKNKTIARVCESLGQSRIRSVEYAGQSLKFYPLKSAQTSSAIDRFGKDEPETLDWINTHIKPGEILWDIGANIGLYSVYAGLKGAKVYAFEPSALNFTLLVEHIHLNNCYKNVLPLCVALGTETKIDMLNMNSFEIGHASNSLGNSQNQFESIDPVFAQAIPAFHADDFIKFFNLPKPDHIKLDVDGNELMIMEGLKNILQSVRTVSIEVEGRNAEGENLQRIESLLSGFTEDLNHRSRGHQRNRLYIRAN